VPEPPARRPRIADVAREAGVSKTAVSFAFNNPDRLAAGTAVRIREVADTLGYRPDPVARMLTRRATRTLGVLTPQALSVIFSNPFFGAFSEGVAAVAEEAGYGIHFISPLHGSLLDAVGGAIVDGVVVVGLSADHPEIAGLGRAGLPIVLVDSTAMREHSSVDDDDEGGAEAAAAHLARLGHRAILVIGIHRPPTPDVALLPAAAWGDGGVAARRLHGYRVALQRAGIELTDADVITGPATVDGGRQAVLEAWAAGRRPTGILAMSDAAAIGAIQALRELGLDVPADVSVVGFDDIDLAAHVDPPLTSVHQPIREKGRTAARLLMRVIEAGEPPAAVHRRLATRLVVRASSGPAPERTR
jgi:DNA-binding LacI/PurR family transcriptional regulator